MVKQIQTALKDIVAVHGDLAKPVPPGAVFATLPSEEDFRSVEELADLPYPPILTENAGCVFDPEERTLTASVWGRVVFSLEGLRVKPCWRMSRDKMVITVSVGHVDFDGEKITLERIQAYMPKALESVEADMDYSAVETALQEAEDTCEEVSVTVAQGTMPKPEKDAYLDLTFNIDQTAGTLREDGTMDFRERSDLHSVAEGGLLGKLHPAEEGAPGVDLFGNEISASVAKPFQVRIGQGVNVTEGESGITMYTAARTGVARFRDGVLEVTELLEISGDVDFSTGNIHAEHGSIHIKGDVKTGFVVECSEDIIIDGVVEEADITAGGLVIAGGVIMNGNNKISARGNVSAHFFRNAIIEAGGEVTAEQELSHCTVVANGKVSVLGAKGIISGGHIISGDDIHASIIGNKARVDTCVEIRVPDVASDKLDAAKEQFEKELVRLSKAIGVDFKLSQLMSAPVEDRRILAELIKVRAQIQREIRDIESSKDDLLLEAQKTTESKRITADQRAYGGTEVIICGKGHKLKSDVDSPSFYLDIESQQIAWK